MEYRSYLVPRMNCMIKFRPLKAPQTNHLLFLGYLLFTASFFLIRINLGGQNSHIITSVTDFDTNAVYSGVENYIQDGPFKSWFYPNRKGFLRIDYYPNSGGCIYDKKAETNYFISDIVSNPAPLYSLRTNCYYLHYPQLSYLYFYVLYQVNLLTQYDFKSYLYAIFPIYLILMATIFLIMARLTASYPAAFITSLFFIFSKAHLDFQFDIHTVPFELMFFTLAVYHTLLKKYHLVPFFIFGAVFSGFDFLLPSLAFTIFSFIKCDKRHRKVLYIGIFLVMAFLLYYGLARFALQTDQQLMADLGKLIPERIKSGGFFQSILEGVPNYFSYIVNVLINSWTLVILMIFIFFRSYQKKNFHQIFVLLIALLIGLNLFFIVPSSSAFHVFSKARFLSFFILTVLAYALSELFKLKKRSLIIVSLTLLLAIQFKFLGTIYAFFYESFTMHVSRKNNTYGLDKIVEFTIGKRTKSDPLDKNHWNMINSRKVYLKPSLPLDHAYYSEDLPMLNSSFEMFFQTNSYLKDSVISIVYPKTTDQEIECTIELMQNNQITTSEVITNSRNWENYQRLDIELPQLTTNLFKVYCPKVKNIKLTRVWIAPHL